jgi:hypothetical protein
MEANLEKMGLNPREKEAIVEQQEIPNEEIAIHSLKACQNKRTACQEMMEAHLECKEPTSADIKACQEMTVCHELTETDTEKIQPNPRIMQSVAEHQEVLKEDAVMKTVEGWKQQHRGQKLAAGRRGGPKELTRGDCGSQRKLAAACRKVSRHATVAWRKRRIFRKILKRGNCGLCQEMAADR